MDCICIVAETSWHCVASQQAEQSQRRKRLPPVIRSLGDSASSAISVCFPEDFATSLSSWLKLCNEESKLFPWKNGASNKHGPDRYIGFSCGHQAILYGDWEPTLSLQRFKTLTQ